MFFSASEAKAGIGETKVGDAMIASRLFGLVVVALLWGGLSNSATANSMAVGAKVLPPIGFIEFCIRNPGECSEVTAMPRPLTLTPQRLTELDRVQWEVNRQVRPREDLDQYGKAEYWNYPGRFGDCEDYAVAKYFLLRELGFPAEDMRVLVTYEKSARDYHAVLAVRRDDGSSWLLESDDTIVKGNHRRYRFIYALNEEGIWDHGE